MAETIGAPQEMQLPALAGSTARTPGGGPGLVVELRQRHDLSAPPAVQLDQLGRIVLRHGDVRERNHMTAGPAPSR
ncbi:hypothetical protein D3869_14740 (plasmid) [Azospirillum brasilense]|uniref:Uncharacterized protein n=1 Tax=Azospirillum brasilense TaxID=192 RepID=A0A4D8R780_AZOBR|nr:hypothetical protein [Azospirillum brasilense]QCO16576.1 hypothetical protein D3869_14740 [Azospirillum brasilense]